MHINGGPGTDTIVVDRHADRRRLRRHRHLHRGRRPRRPASRASSASRSTAPAAPTRSRSSARARLIETIVDGGSGDDDDPHRRHAAAARLRPAAVHLHAARVRGAAAAGHRRTTTRRADLGGWTFTVNLATWLAAGGNIFNPGSTSTAATNLATTFANHIGALRHIFDPLSNYTGATVTNAHARLRFAFIPFLFDTIVQVDVDDIQLHYSVGVVTQDTKLIQPPSITVDPPAFAFQAAGVTSLAGIQGRLTIRGGDAPEGLGDRVIVHNESSSFSGAGSLLTFTQPRYVQTGQDSLGNPIIEQDADTSGATPVPLFDSSLELRGMGLGIANGANTALNGRTVFHGIELQGIESIDIRLAGGDDTFTVSDTGFTRATNGSQTTTLLPTTLAISGGGGNDTINLEQVGGATTIIGGAGADTVNIHSTTQTLAQILGRVSFDGDATITEPPVAFLDNDPRLQIFLTTNSVIIPTGGLLHTTDASNTPYHLASLVPVLVDPVPATIGSALQVRVAVLNPSTGEVTTEFVQERGVLEFAKQKRNASGVRLWFANDGGETTDSTHHGHPGPDLENANTPYAREQVYMDSAFNKVLVNTGHRHTRPTGPARTSTSTTTASR